MIKRNRDILYRLINKGRVVGWEKHENGKIYHNCLLYAMEKVSVNWYDILQASKEYGRNDMSVTLTHPYYIDHTRKDQYTGVDIDGVKMFERDEAELLFNEYYSNNQISIDEGATFKGTVRFIDGSYEIIGHGNCSIFLYELLQEEIDIKIIGISGVTNEHGGASA